MRQVVAFALLVAASACDDGFTPRSLVTGVRVLAVRAEPPEARVGQSVRLDALVAGVETATVTYRWLACERREPDLLSPCARARALEAPDQLEGMQDVTLIGTSSVVTYRFEGPLAEQALPHRVIILLLVAESGSAPTVSSKDLVISRSGAPNANPEIELILLQGVEFGAQALAAVEPGQVLFWSAITTATTAEQYTRTTLEGGSETVSENVTYQWLSTAGEFGFGAQPPDPTPLINFVRGAPPAMMVVRSPREGGGDPSADDFGFKVVHTIPGNATIGAVFDVFVVVRDGRGGTDWARRKVTARTSK